MTWLRTAWAVAVAAFTHPNETTVIYGHTPKENSMTSNVPVPVDVVADPKKPWKAIVAGAVAFLGLLWAALAGRDDWANMTAQEWVSIIVPTILTFAATYAVPNPKVLSASVRGARKSDLGYGELGLVIGVLLVVILVVVLLRVL